MAAGFFAIGLRWLGFSENNHLTPPYGAGVQLGIFCGKPPQKSADGTKVSGHEVGEHDGLVMPLFSTDA